MVGATHLRQRSSIALSSTTASPLVAYGAYDDRTGEIMLPRSPPLHSWKEKEKPSLGMYGDEKNGRLPPYAWSSEPRRTMKRPWLSLLTVAGCTFAFVVLLSYLAPEG